MAETYVSAIRDGAVPCIENAVDAMAQIENARAMEEGVQLYRKLFQEDVIFPTPDSETLPVVHSKALSSAIKHFLDKVFCDKNQEFQIRMNVSGNSLRAVPFKNVGRADGNFLGSQPSTNFLILAPNHTPNFTN